MPTTPAGPLNVPLKNRYLAAFLAWLVPGLGHIYQGRIAKGLLYGVTILSLFFVGRALGDWNDLFWRWLDPLKDSERFRYGYVGAFFTGLAAFPALVQATLVHYGHDPILRGFMAEPPSEVYNALFERCGRFLEIGGMYTTVAGLLNILAILDAAGGPAYAALETAELSKDKEKDAPDASLPAPEVSA